MEHPENSKQKKQQIDLYGYLDDVIEISQKKLAIEKKADSDRQAWARIIVSAVQAYGRIIELAEIEELKQRLEALEQQYGAKLT